MTELRSTDLQTRWSAQARFLVAVSICVALALNAGCSGDRPQTHDATDTSTAEQEVWRFAIEESEGSVQHAYALEFQRLVESRMEGDVQVVIYPYGTLGTSTHMTEQLNLGALEFAMASPGSLGKFIPEMQAFLLHFVLPEEDRQLQKVLSDPALVEDLDPLYAEKGLQLLSIFSEGAMVWTLKDEVRSPDDFQGIKMRVMTSPLLLKTYNAYGASATPMPYAEVYSALQLNMIDGQVNPVFAIERQKFHEVTSWMVFPGHASFITTCAANRNFIDSLDEERRRTLREIFDELNSYIFDIQFRFQTERLKDVILDKKEKQSRLHVCADLARFRASLSAAEQRELIDDNAYLDLEPPLTDDERRRFREVSREVESVFLRIGGDRAADVLDRLKVWESETREGKIPTELQ